MKQKDTVEVQGINVIIHELEDWKSFVNMVRKKNIINKMVDADEMYNYEKLLFFIGQQTINRPSSERCTVTFDSIYKNMNKIIFDSSKYKDPPAKELLIYKKIRLRRDVKILKKIQRLNNWLEKRNKNHEMFILVDQKVKKCKLLRFNVYNSDDAKDAPTFSFYSQKKKLKAYLKTHKKEMQTNINQIEKRTETIEKSDVLEKTSQKHPDNIRSSRQMRIIYGVCSWGLGHASRSLPVIRKLVSEHFEVMVISSGRALEFLKIELTGHSNVSFSDIPDYTPTISSNPVVTIPDALLKGWMNNKIIRKEHEILERKILSRGRHDMIISDTMYGIYDRNRPSYIITHQLRFLNPFRIRFVESGMEIFNKLKFNNQFAVIVPDFRDDSLSGELSHNLRYIDENKLDYVGPLSDFKKIEKPKDIKAFISISGSEPHRTKLESLIMKQVPSINRNDKVVISLGKPEKSKFMGTENIGKANELNTYNFISKEKMEELLNRSEVVVSRAGYSTIMDLAVLGKKALLIPIPNQSEQEYLARYNREKGHFNSVMQDEMDLERDIAKALKFPSIHPRCTTEESVENIMRVIFSGEKIRN